MTCSHDQEHYHVLAVPHRCRVRLCPSCSTAAAHVAAAQMVDILTQLQADDADAWIMLTLTAPNVPADKLKDAIGHMLKAWTRLSRYKEVSTALTGWARRMEITYNPQRKDYHPHIHVLMHVKSSYKSINYIKHARWVELWQQALGVDYAPVVDVRRVSSAKGAIEATGKYALKPIALEAIADNPTACVAVMEALHRRRLLDYGGDVARARKALAQPDPEAVEDARPTECPTCGSKIVQTIHRWTEDAYVRYATIDGLDTSPLEGMTASIRPRSPSRA